MKTAIRYKDTIKNITLNALNCFTLQGTTPCYPEWDTSCTRILNVLIKEKVISEREVDGRIYFRLLSLGRESYEQLKRIRDHTRITSPYAIAYALHHGYFSPAELKMIRLGYGKAAVSFYKLYFRKNLKYDVLAFFLEEGYERR